MQELVLAHLSDPHLPCGLPPGSRRSLTLKQTLSLSSWAYRRRHLHRQHVLDALRNDVENAGCCHVAVTGDLINFGHPAEFAAGRDWLATLGSPDRVSFVCGNHDRLGNADPMREAWAPWSRGDAGEPAPWLRRRGNVALIGLDSGIRTPLLLAGGLLGAEQIGKAAVLLRQAADAGLFRVVLIHHPPLRGPGGWRRSLFDAAGLRDMLAGAGAELVLHGHHHRAMQGILAGPDRQIPVSGVPSASMFGKAHAQPSAWRRYTIERMTDGAASGCRVSCQTRNYNAELNLFETTDRQEWLVR